MNWAVEQDQAGPLKIPVELWYFWGQNRGRRPRNFDNISDIYAQKWQESLIQTRGHFRWSSHRFDTKEDKICHTCDHDPDRDHPQDFCRSHGYSSQSLATQREIYHKKRIFQAADVFSNAEYHFRAVRRALTPSFFGQVWYFFEDKTTHSRTGLIQIGHSLPYMASSEKGQSRRGRYQTFTGNFRGPASGQPCTVIAAG